MAKRGDVEISNSSGTVLDTGQAIAVVEGAAAAPAPVAPAMEVGASLSDLLIGKQPDTINLANKSTSLENSDSALYAAIISGDTDYVARRMASTGVKGEGAALLLIRTKRKAEEKSFTQTALAVATEKLLQETRRVDSAQAYVQARNVDAYNAYQDERLDAKERRLDIFGGYLAAGIYTDKFGGSYDDYGYTSADGNILKSYGGEVLNKLLGTITLSTGEEHKIAAPIVEAGLEEFLFKKAIDLGGDTPSSLRLARAYEMFENAGATPDMLDDIALFLETGVKPSSAIATIIDVVLETPEGRRLVADLLADNEAISLSHRLLIDPVLGADHAPLPGEHAHHHHAAPAAASASSKSSFTTMPATPAAAAANAAATAAKAQIAAGSVAEAIANNPELAKAANETPGGAVEEIGRAMGDKVPRMTKDSLEFAEAAIAKQAIVSRNLEMLKKLDIDMHRGFASKNVCDHVESGHCDLSDAFKEHAAQQAGDRAAKKAQRRQEMLKGNYAKASLGVRRAERAMSGESDLQTGFRESILGDTTSVDVTPKKVHLQKNKPKPSM